MDVGSPNMEDGTPLKSELDLNSHENKDEERTERLQDDDKELEETQIYVDQGRLRSPVLPDGVVSEELQSSTMISNCAASSSPINEVEDQDKPSPNESDFDDDVEKKSLVHSIEEMGPHVEDHEYHDEQQQASYNIQSGDLDVDVDQTAKDENKSGDSDPDFHGPVLSADNNLDSQSKHVEFDNDGTEDGNVSHNMEMKEDDRMIDVAHVDNGEMFTESSVGHSPLPTQKGTPSPSPERELPVHMVKSPDNKTSVVQDKLPTEISDRKSNHSPRPTPSPEKRTVGHKRASRDSLSPPARRKSPPGKAAHQDAHRRDSSPRKNLSASPRRRDRSTSRSPVRRKDSSGHRRDHRGRSRSRSPHARDHYRRSPRRRHSPGRRSPPSYHSRHRSPRRPWSPPTNRNTGVGRPGRNLFVAGFSYVTTERDLEKKFSRFGRVTDVRIVRDRRSGDSRGFGFLSLERDEDADAAIRALDQTEWNGRIVLVEKSKTSAR